MKSSSLDRFVPKTQAESSLRVLHACSGSRNRLSFVHQIHLQTRTRGTVNGFSHSLIAIARSMGPAVGGPVFAWSESNGR